VLIIQARLRATTLEAFIARMPAWSVAIIWVLMAAAVLLVQGEGSAFIYFQF
jgi:hypothetical protein